MKQKINGFESKLSLINDEPCSIQDINIKGLEKEIIEFKRNIKTLTNDIRLNKQRIAGIIAGTL